MKHASHPCPCNSHNRSQLGFSMLEILVSLVVMALGLLGMGRLMIASINNAVAIDVSSRASQSAHSIAEAMRAATVNSDTYTTAYGASISGLTGTEAKDSDRKLWLETLRRLPDGDGKIEWDASLVEATVTVRFNNCLGTLSASETTNCANTTDLDARKRSIKYALHFQ